MHTCPILIAVIRLYTRTTTNPFEIIKSLIIVLFVHLDYLTLNFYKGSSKERDELHVKPLLLTNFQGLLQLLPLLQGKGLLAFGSPTPYDRC